MADTMSNLALQGSSTAASALRDAAQLLRSTLGRGGAPQLQIALGPSRAWSFDVRRDPIEIQLLDGEVMVTFEGDLEDHILAQGATFRTSGRGRVAVVAFRASRFSVAAA
jgi:Protein of unknown function (DUF2917)